ncbi:unnamed protein product [Ilex paraguariensis]|uniref:Uncharacterized protein n=1 Tax=Ilex paraguariensis TaxID=185542 RepID=A0ABC8S074_9AQUA
MKQGQSNKSTSVKYNPHEDSGTGFPIEPPRGVVKNGFSHSNSMIHPCAVGYSWTKKVKEDAGHTVPGWAFGSSQHGAELSRQSSHMPNVSVESSNIHPKKDERVSCRDTMGYVPKRNRILCSGPLMPPGGNMEDMLKEHERQIQEAVRKARLDKARTKKNCYDYGQSN